MRRIFVPVIAGLCALVWLGACAPAPVVQPIATATIIPPTASLVPTVAPALTATPARPAQASIFPEITAEDWQKGPADAKVTLIEYGDYQ